MVTARVQATQQGTATRSSQPGARTGSPALATAPWMSSTPPPPSGQSACLPLWDSLPVYHSGTVCQSTTLRQSACLPLWDSLRVYHFGTVCLSTTLGQSACLPLWDSLRVYHFGTVCLSITVGQSAGLLLWNSLPSDGSNCPCVRLSMHLPVCMCSNWPVIHGIPQRHKLPACASACVSVLCLSVPVCLSVPACGHPAVCLSAARNPVKTRK